MHPWLSGLRDFAAFDRPESASLDSSLAGCAPLQCGASHVKHKMPRFLFFGEHRLEGHLCANVEARDKRGFAADGDGVHG
jgi:hypothetical protein